MERLRLGERPTPCQVTTWVFCRFVHPTSVPTSVPFSLPRPRFEERVGKEMEGGFNMCGYSSRTLIGSSRQNLQRKGCGEALPNPADCPAAHTIPTRNATQGPPMARFLRPPGWIQGQTKRNETWGFSGTIDPSPVRSGPTPAPIVTSRETTGNLSRHLRRGWKFNASYL